MEQRRIKVLHLITGLDVGGAETTLYKLLSRMSSDLFHAEVVSLTDVGPVGEKIRALGIPVRALGMPRGLPDPRAVWRLFRLLRQGRPQLMQTWMYHADLLGGIAARLAGGPPVVWGVHHSNLDMRENKLTTVWTAKVCARLSGLLPAGIVCCAEASRKVHAALGYVRDRMRVIPNGFDLEAFKPDPAARLSVRRELGLAGETPLIGLAARFDRQKDHLNFVSAAGKVAADYPEARFLLCGRGVTAENEELDGWLRAAGVRDSCYLLGQREDVPRLMAALDIAVSSSLGEAFPLVVGEAMACGVPCVVTDVGDSALIVGDTGRVVPPGDFAALARGIGELLETGAEQRNLLGEAARRRIGERFSLPEMIAGYERLYREIVPH